MTGFWRCGGPTDGVVREMLIRLSHVPRRIGARTPRPAEGGERKSGCAFRPAKLFMQLRYSVHGQTGTG